MVSAIGAITVTLITINNNVYTATIFSLKFPFKSDYEAQFIVQ